MFKFIKRLTKSKNENSKNFKREMAKHLDGRAIKFVIERIDGNDFGIGRDGALIVKDDELIVYSSADIVFRAKIDELKASELLSLEGVILTAADITHGGRERTVIAYYTYYMKPGKGL
jgi:hypothetical protein